MLFQSSSSTTLSKTASSSFRASNSTMSKGGPAFLFRMSGPPEWQHGESGTGIHQSIVTVQGNFYPKDGYVRYRRRVGTAAASSPLQEPDARKRLSFIDSADDDAVGQLVMTQYPDVSLGC